MSRRHGKHTVFMMDLWATVPYYTAYLSQALKRAGVDVMIGSISYYLDPECFRSRGLRTEPGLLDVVGRFQIPAGPRRVLKFAEALLNMAALTVRFLFHPPAVVHVQYLPLLRWRLPFERWFLSFCRARGAPIVLTVHDLLPHDSGERFRALFASLYADVDCIICHSQSVRARLETEFSIAAEKIAAIPHGPFFYDLPNPGTEGFVRSSPDEVLVLWQGILFPYKGVDVLLRAWGRVEQKMPHARLLIAGTGAPELMAELRAEAAALALQRVSFDFRFVSAEELVGLYRSADVVVYPYSAITTSGALATGLALNKAILASDLPVFRELLRDGENALLAPPRNSEALADALVRLLADSGLRARLAASVASMNFGDQSWQSIAEATRDVYRAVGRDNRKDRSPAHA